MVTVTLLGGKIVPDRIDGGRTEDRKAHVIRFLVRLPYPRVLTIPGVEVRVYWKGPTGRVGNEKLFFSEETQSYDWTLSQDVVADRGIVKAELRASAEEYGDVVIWHSDTLLIHVDQSVEETQADGTTAPRYQEATVRVHMVEADQEASGSASQGATSIDFVLNIPRAKDGVSGVWVGNAPPEGFDVWVDISQEPAVLRTLDKESGEWRVASGERGPQGPAVKLSETTEGTGNALTGLRLDGETLVQQKNQVFATRKEMLEGLGGKIAADDYATGEKAGTVIPGEGLSISATGSLSVKSATQDMLEEKKDAHFPITSSVLDLAVKLALVSSSLTLTVEEQAAVLNWLAAQGRAIQDAAGHFREKTVEGALAEAGAGLAALKTGSPIVEVTTSKTLGLSDVGTCQEVTADSPDTLITITIPAQSAVAWPERTEIEIMLTGESSVVIAAADGVTVNSMDDMREIAGKHGSVTLKRMAQDRWNLGGALA